MQNNVLEVLSEGICDYNTIVDFAIPIYHHFRVTVKGKGQVESEMGYMTLKVALKKYLLRVHLIKMF